MVQHLEVLIVPVVELVFFMISSDLTTDAIRVQLAKVLGSSTFASTGRLWRFLNYIVEETLAGRGAQIKELVIGIDVFGKPTSYDPRLDPIVRVEAGRLRKKLCHYYQTTGYTDPIVIEIANGCYTPRFMPRQIASAGSSQAMRRTTDARVYGLYLKGRYCRNQRSEKSLAKAVKFFEQAAMEDSQFTLAYVGLADSYILLTNYGAVCPDRVRGLAKSVALRAVEIDSSLAETHTTLGHVKATCDWDWTGAEAEFLSAISLDPSYATAHQWYATTCLTQLGRLHQAIEEICLAERSDPISLSILNDRAWLYYHNRQFERAIKQCHSILHLEPNFYGAYRILCLAFEQKREFDKALVAIEKAISLSHRNPRMLGTLGHLYAMADRKGQAECVLNELRHMAKHRYVSPYELAIVDLALGKIDSALEFLHKAVEGRVFDITSARSDPRLEPLRGHKGFEQILDKLWIPLRSSETS